MYTGSHAAPRRRSSGRKPLLILLSLLLITALSIGGTLAYLSAKTEKDVKNTFSPADVPIEIIEEFDDGVKSSIKLKNTGSVPALVRLAVVITAVNEAGEPDFSRDNELSLSINAADWTMFSTSVGQNVYYCNKIVPPGELTEELLREPLSITGYQVDVLAQSVQAAGTIEGVSAAEKAWGHSFTLTDSAAGSGTWS